ncbi:MAG: AbrB/MazE/SpoVT family DNA-binding domain-containing protein [Bacilli bacterium]|nr:AbrB/MazE/SpoVT family DNA-binding domain-containing protein [Bacilli bacterium]
MKSTGVIRRIDELGRIVIPKEIRRHLGIREGENLEIFTEEDRIVLKKYSKMLEYGDLSSKLCEIVPSTMDLGLVITDRDKVVSFSSNVLLDLSKSEIDNQLLSYIQSRESYESKVNEKMEIGDYEIEGYFYIQPIISSIDCLGLIILFKDQTFLKEEKQFAKFLAQMIANKIDIS